MTDLKLTEGLFLNVTPGGAYSAVVAEESNPSRQFLRNLLADADTPELSLDELERLSGSGSDDALELLKHLQTLEWVEGLEQKETVSEAPLEEVMPSLLKALSGSEKALLADEQGFYLASSGFPHEVAEELSALSAELATLHKRRSGLLENNLTLGSSAWSIVNACGHSKIGFWPLFIGKQRFVLVIEGVPSLNRVEFVELVRMLSRRYGIES